MFLFICVFFVCLCHLEFAVYWSYQATPKRWHIKWVIHANKGFFDFALSSEEPFLLYVSVNSFGERTVLTVLFICPDSGVLGEQRGLLTMGQCLDEFKWPAWPELQIAVSFLASLNILTLSVKDGKCLSYTLGYGHLLYDDFIRPVATAFKIKALRFASFCKS